MNISKRLIFNAGNHAKENEVDLHSGAPIDHKFSPLTPRSLKKVSLSRNTITSPLSSLITTHTGSQEPRGISFVASPLSLDSGLCSSTDLNKKSLSSNLNLNLNSILSSSAQYNQINTLDFVVPKLPILPLNKAEDFRISSNQNRKVRPVSARGSFIKNPTAPRSLPESLISSYESDNISKLLDSDSKKVEIIETKVPELSIEMFRRRPSTARVYNDNTKNNYIPLSISSISPPNNSKIENQERRRSTPCFSNSSNIDAINSKPPSYEILNLLFLPYSQHPIIAVGSFCKICRLADFSENQNNWAHSVTHENDILFAVNASSRKQIVTADSSGAIKISTSNTGTLVASCTIPDPIIPLKPRKFSLVADGSRLDYDCELDYEDNIDSIPSTLTNKKSLLPVNPTSATSKYLISSSLESQIDKLTADSLALNGLTIFFSY